MFYETLLSQRPTSEMAQEWCLAYGIMEEDKAKTAFKAMEKRKLKNQQKVKAEKKNSSSKIPAPGDTKTKKKKKSKKVLDDVAFDAGIDAGGDEGIGVSAL